MKISFSVIGWISIFGGRHPWEIAQMISILDDLCLCSITNHLPSTTISTTSSLLRFHLSPGCRCNRPLHLSCRPSFLSRSLPLPPSLIWCRLFWTYWLLGVLVNALIARANHSRQSLWSFVLGEGMLDRLGGVERFRRGFGWGGRRWRWQRGKGWWADS